MDEDKNLPTRSAKPEPPSKECSTNTDARTNSGQDIQRYLSPAPRSEISAALASALVLCVPAGFSEDDRALWLKVATETVKDIPADILRQAIIEARKVADHPSKIVPFITGYANGDTGQSKNHYISASGYVYHSRNPEDVMREAERRADWSTYYLAKSDMRHG